MISAWLTVIAATAAAHSCAAFSTHIPCLGLGGGPGEADRVVPPKRGCTTSTRVSLTAAASTFDVVLSSGGLCFGAHCGFLEAVEKSFSRSRVGAVVGTSSGALAGALWAAGYTGHEVARIIKQHASDGRLARPRKLSLQPWEGLLSLSEIVELLGKYLPPSFEELPLPLAVGVQDSHGERRLLTSGGLPAAIAASLAVPILFEPVTVDGVKLRSACARDRTGLSSRSRWRPGQRTIVHLVDRARNLRETEGRDVDAWVKDPRTVLVRSPRSKSSLRRGLVDFESERFFSLKHTLRITAPETLSSLPLMYPDEIDPIPDPFFNSS